MDEGVEKVHPQGVEKVRVQSGPRRRPLFTPEELEEIRRADEDIKRDALNRKKAIDRAYREAHREKISSYLRAYRAANRERIAATRRAYYEANRERLLDAQRAYYEANRERFAEIGAALRRWREEHACSQTELGELLEISRAAVYRWENGLAPIDFDRIRAKCPRVMEAFI